ncbi:MAG TPA: hypothetical protein ENN11_04115 [Methanomicrobia archaeon]|nr:hypothetical protein [Methanomicrobia archaeon]
MHDDIERIYEILEEIRSELRELKELQKSSQHSSSHEGVGRRISSPPTSSNYVEIREKSKWDSSSIDGLIE